VATTDERGGSLEKTRAVPAQEAPAAEGDDIVVIPADSGDPLGPSRRGIVAAAGIVAILVIVGAIALVARHSSPSTRLQTAPQSTVAQIPVVAKGPKLTPVKPKTGPPIAVATVEQTVAPTTAARVVVPASVAAQTTPPTPAPTTTPPPPKQYGPSVLTWDQPHQLTIRAGYTKVLPVTAHNPTDGTVNLPHPLSCAPRLDHSEMCPEMVQPMGPGQSASAQYTIDARGVAKGNYTLSIEGVLTVRVTVS
jgi:hypothetical protein